MCESSNGNMSVKEVLQRSKIRSENLEASVAILLSAESCAISIVMVEIINKTYQTIIEDAIDTIAADLL